MQKEMEMDGVINKTMEDNTQQGAKTPKVHSWKEVPHPLPSQNALITAMLTIILSEVINHQIILKPIHSCFAARCTARNGWG